jgi:hypothetical protein
VTVFQKILGKECSGSERMIADALKWRFRDVDWLEPLWFTPKTTCQGERLVSTPPDPHKLPNEAETRFIE